MYMTAVTTPFLDVEWPLAGVLVCVFLPIGIGGKSSELVQCAMLKACDACADMGQL